MRFLKSKRKDVAVKPSKREVRNMNINKAKSSFNRSLLMANKEESMIACLSV